LTLIAEELDALRQREAQLSGDLFVATREAALAREESARLQDALNHAQATDAGAVSAEVERCQAELSKVRIELDKALGEGFSLRETISELRAQIDSLERGRQTDAANLRMYINENDTLRKRCALCDWLTDV
jgi:predicted nuclease with TOPRIM domain